MKACHLLSAFTSLVFMLSASAGQCENIRFITEPNVNIDASGRSFSGESELTRDLMRRLDITGDVEVYPWKRAYTMLKKEPNIALFPTTRTEARENDAHWVGPILKVSWVFFANKNSNIEIKSLKDAMQARQICGYLGDAKLTFLENKGFKNLTYRYRSFDCIELLANNRVDLWISTTTASLRDSEASPYKVSDLKVVYTINTNYLYYALSKDIPAETVELLQQTIDSMKREGVFPKYYKGFYSEDMIREISRVEEPEFPWVTSNDKQK